MKIPCRLLRRCGSMAGKFRVIVVGSPSRKSAYGCPVKRFEKLTFPNRPLGCRDFVGRTQDELIAHLQVVASAEPAHMIDKLLNQVASARIARAEDRDRRNRNAREVRLRRCRRRPGRSGARPRSPSLSTNCLPLMFEIFGRSSKDVPHRNSFSRFGRNRMSVGDGGSPQRAPPADSVL